MPRYVDGFVIAMPKKNLEAYKKLAKLAGKVWIEHGALDYYECVGDDMKVKMGLPFPETIKAKKGEIAIFSFIVYKSRTHRDAVNKKVMADKRLANACSADNMPFDMKRMTYGGFETIVQVSG